MTVDIAGFITDMKAHAVDHGFHVHAERHFIESFSLGQAWEVDLHPEEACEGPLEMLMVLEVDPRVILAFEDLMAQHHLELEMMLRHQVARRSPTRPICSSSPPSWPGSRGRLCRWKCPPPTRSCP